MQTRAFAASRSALVEAAKQFAAQAQSAMSLAELDALARAMEPLMREASMAVRAQVLDALAPALRAADLERVVLVAGLCGLLIDDGLSHAAAEEAIVERYLELAHGARRFHEAREQCAHGGARALAGDELAYRLLARAPAPAVSVLSASRRARTQGRALATVLAPLAQELPGARALVVLAEVLDDAPWLAIDPGSGRGLRGRLSGVSNVEQLHVLLMDRLLPRDAASRPSRAVVANAEGRGPKTLAETVSAAFSLHSYRALSAQGVRDDPSEVLWNERRPGDIPLFEGVRAIVIAPQSVPRSWLAEREFARMRAELTVDHELTTTDVDALLTRMRNLRPAEGR